MVPGDRQKKINKENKKKRKKRIYCFLKKNLFIVKNIVVNTFIMENIDI